MNSCDTFARSLNSSPTRLHPLAINRRIRALPWSAGLRPGSAHNREQCQDTRYNRPALHKKPAFCLLCHAQLNLSAKNCLTSPFGCEIVQTVKGRCCVPGISQFGVHPSGCRAPLLPFFPSLPWPGMREMPVIPPIFPARLGTRNSNHKPHHSITPTYPGCAPVRACPSLFEVVRPCPSYSEKKIKFFPTPFSEANL
jgi:hypothetical protein